MRARAKGGDTAKKKGFRYRLSVKPRLSMAPDDALGTVETIEVVEYDVRLSKVRNGQEPPKSDSKEEPPATRGGA